MNPNYEFKDFYEISMNLIYVFVQFSRTLIIRFWDFIFLPLLFDFKLKSCYLYDEIMIDSLHLFN